MSALTVSTSDVVYSSQLSRASSVSLDMLGDNVCKLASVSNSPPSHSYRKPTVMLKKALSRDFKCSKNAFSL